MQHIGFSIHLLNYTNNSWLLFPKTFSHSLTNIHWTPSNSGIAQVIVNGPFTHLLIKKPRNSTSHHYSHAKIMGFWQEECKNVIKNWQIIFQAFNFKGKHFLDLLNNKLLSIEPLYIKRSPWIKHSGHLNSFCVRATRTIINHTPMGEYHLWFFFRKNFSCPCRIYSTETRHHILHNCRTFNNY